MEWVAKQINHKGSNRIAVYFSNTAELNNRIKKLVDAKWSNTLKAWHLPDTTENRKRFQLSVGSSQSSENAAISFLNITSAQSRHGEPVEPHLSKTVVSNQLSANIKPEKNHTNHLITDNQLPPTYPIWLADFVRLLKVKNYSTSTVRTYRNAILLFYQYYKNVQLEMISQKDIERYLLFLIEEKKYSASAVNTTVNAVKFLMEKIFKRPKSVYDLPRPKRPLQLPKVMNEKEVIGVLNALDNIKHKAILYLAYSAGLRVSEVIHLKITDIDSSRMTLHLTAAKGKKDRIVTLGKVALENLRLYYKKYKPKVYLFEGASGEQYSMRSAQSIFNQAKTKAGIKKEITFHSLRHSYATHLLENGTDIRFIKELLGHNDIKTTVRYTHVSKKSIEQIESPLDKLMRNNF